MFYEPIFCRKWDVLKIMSIPGILLASISTEEVK